MFLHSYHPNPILLEFWSIKIYWYGFFIVIGIFVAFNLSQWLLKKYIEVENIPSPFSLTEGGSPIDLFYLSIYLIIGGLIGARLAHVIAEWQYYISQPLEILKIWNGGLWIYGAVIGGFIGLIGYVYNEGDHALREEWSHLQFGKMKRKLWNRIVFLLDMLSPGLIFAQAIGRWGNYFNQEIYGIPTKLPWGIPIDSIHIVPGFTGNNFFHPTFLYESIWCAILGIILLKMHRNRFKRVLIEAKKLKKGIKWGNIFLWYLFLYSLGRFLFEFLRIDSVPLLFGVRITQIVASATIILTIIFLLKQNLTKSIIHKFAS